MRLGQYLNGGNETGIQQCNLHNNTNTISYVSVMKMCECETTIRGGECEVIRDRCDEGMFAMQ